MSEAIKNDKYLSFVNKIIEDLRKERTEDCFDYDVYDKEYAFNKLVAHGKRTKDLVKIPH